MHIFKNTNFDFLKWRVHAIVLSWAIIVAGAFVFFTRGIPLGIEFAGGTEVILKFEQPVSIQQVRAAIDKGFPGGGAEAVINAFGDPALHQVMIRVPTVGAESGTALTSTADQVETALKQANLGGFTRVGTEIVGPAVGKELRSKALLATVLSLLGILLYLAFRFQFSFGVGAVVATIHDLLITLAFLAFFRYDMTLNVIAAILTITGFSTNDTIVIFDRIRENLRGMRRDSMRHVINVSINQTLGRTVITSGTALLTALALFFFGGEVLHGFAFTMIVGIVTGTYSSVFIAAAIISFWRGRARAGGRRHAAAAAAQDQGDAQGESVVGLPTLVKAALLGIVQGLFEFLPVSSTAHLILGARALGYDDPGGLFIVMIQFGSILAVMWLYRAKILGVVGGLASRPEARRFALMIVVAFIPAAVAGVLLERPIKRVLYYSPLTIAAAFIAGGIVILLVERARPKATVSSVDDVPLPSALAVGASQAVALIPGVSRSGATIVAGLLAGLDRPTAAELSFFLAMPTMAGAFVKDAFELRHQFSPERGLEIAVGFVLAFLASLVVVKPFLAIVRRSGFGVFAWYRIAAGLVVLAALGFGWL
jgi:undecaprenyl-diphosphatase UppP